MSETFDVFFSYRRGDREIVHEIAAYLSKAGIRPWIDEDQLPPGRPWLDGLHEAMKASKAAAVFIGPHGIGDWQLPEVRYLLDRMVKSELPVIPVLLPGAPQEPALEFLAQNTWVDLRGGLGQKDLDRLVWGISGQRHILLSSARPALLDQPTFTLTKPGWLRYQFDRITPRLHLKLTRLGTLVEPLEFQIFNDYLRQLHGQIENAVREETYIPLRGTRLSTRAFDEVAPQDPFVRPIHQVIYQISGRANGGDAATAAIAAVDPGSSRTFWGRCSRRMFP